jgi:hypothetical protein
MKNIQHSTSNNQYPMVIRHAPRTGCSMLNVECWMFLVPSIPTGLHPSAQGCPRQRTTLGQSSKLFSNPNGVASSRRRLMQPLQGCCHSFAQPKVARASQPWAECFEFLQDSPGAKSKNIQLSTFNAQHRTVRVLMPIGRLMLNVEC